jgi:hypothetical protein
VPLRIDACERITMTGVRCGGAMQASRLDPGDWECLICGNVWYGRPPIRIQELRDGRRRWNDGAHRNGKPPERKAG